MLAKNEEKKELEHPSNEKKKKLDLEGKKRRSLESLTSWNESRNIVQVMLVVVHFYSSTKGEDRS